MWYPIAVGTSAKEEGELLWRPNRPKMGFFQNKAKPLESRIREHSGLEEDNQETYPASETSSIRTSIGINPISVFIHLSLVLTAPRKNPGKPTPKHSSHKNKNSPPPRPQHHLQAPPGFPHPQPPPRPLLSHHLSPLSQRPHQQPAHHLVPVPLHLSNRHLLPS